MNAHCAWSQGVRKGIYKGKYSTHDSKTQARNIGQQSHRGCCLIWVYTPQTLIGFFQKFIICKSKHFLDKDGD